MLQMEQDEEGGEEGEELYLEQGGDEVFILDDAENAEVDSDMEDAGNFILFI